MQGRSEASEVGGGGGVLEDFTWNLNFNVKTVINIIGLFLINLHCHSKFPKKRGSVWGSSPGKVHVSEAPGLHYRRFLKQIRKRIGSKLTVFYKKWLSFYNNNVFITQILPENVKILNLSFTVGGGLHPPPPHTHTGHTSLRTPEV
jgi:hypothetical protein